MITLNIVKPNRYQDSVTLMQAASKVRAMPGIEEASLMMGTAPNLQIMAEAGLLTRDGEEAGPNDLIIALRGEEGAVDEAAGRVEEILRADVPSQGERTADIARTLRAGVSALPTANLALISTPGIYAAAEARKALMLGLHVMLFSDNVSVEDEISLKQLATERGLLMMGPDCGTAVIGGVPLGFANSVRRGNIGVVGASGTGMQEVTSLIHRFGGGVSHAIGTGSRDLSGRVGGLMTLAGLRALSADPATRAIVLVSKPPDPSVANALLTAAEGAGKPVVAAFLGMDNGALGPTGSVVLADTLERAARLAVGDYAEQPGTESAEAREVERVTGEMQPRQRYVRGLFSGGTFCYEAMLVLRGYVGAVHSNAPLSPEYALRHTGRAKGHVCLDMGADEYTVGRPHPMIDMSARVERIAAEAADPEVAVLLLDVVLGYGAHPDPAGALGAAIRAARGSAASEGRSLAVVASVCGTETDPQNYEAQRRALEEAGVTVCESNSRAARLAGQIAAARLRVAR